MSYLRNLLVACMLICFANVSHAQVYKGAIVVNATTGEVLFEDRSDVVSPPASVTKLMTFLVIHDAIQAGEITLQTPVEVTADDARMGGTQVWLKHREVFPVEELLYALMIQSANDAAHALSHAAGITREQFVDRMNVRARALGMTDTIWRSPHGLPPRSRRLDETDQTSPRDLAKLSRALLKETDVLRYSSIERRPFGTGVRAKPVMMDNHNNLIGKVRGIDGLKTGFTRAAGFCLAATAERDGRRIVAVIMGSPTSKERDIKMAELIEDAFAKIPTGPFQRMPAESKPAAPVPPATADPEPAPAPLLQFTPISLDDEDSDDAADEAPGDEEPETVRFELPY
ncbi:D-alanyl-D-alanine carboxypeptidase family protein [Synoicihabitans lomoniglobus]|uniref:D-alanyl-D-alanine carboxypeptidase n=1 Tax=Synoicihabitans lomoniglobus TaxID=2909285 RepID=A0AAF0I439_9BACT|nr:D-alanyl-D-alanine carboxypeptidase [Opitutaceae bacterium LMO-M01]WED66270.1 D-alanyl-D-alanine carboxypeptidase [Opitutaceae bacterium LMO-M01]